MAEGICEEHNVDTFLYCEIRELQWRVKSRGFLCSWRGEEGVVKLREIGRLEKMVMLRGVMISWEF